MKLVTRSGMCVWMFFLSIQFPVQAQTNDSIPWSPKVLYMYTWNDSNAVFPYDFRIKLRSYPSKYHDFEGRRYFLKSDAVWIIGQSWLNDSVRDRYLPLSQLYFDLAEWKSRLLQEGINATDSLPELLLFNTETALVNLIDRVGEETDHGADTTAMRYWQTWTDSALTAVPIRKYPEWKYGHVRVGLHAGLGIRAFGSSLKTVLGTTLVNSVGCDLYIRRWLIGLRAGGGAFLRNGAFSAADFSYSDSSRLALRECEFSTGLKLIDRPRIGLTTSMGWNAFRLQNNDVVKGSLFHKSRFSSGFTVVVNGAYDFLNLSQNKHAQTGLFALGSVSYASVHFMELKKGGSWFISLGIGLRIKNLLPVERTPGIYYF